MLLKIELNNRIQCKNAIKFYYILLHSTFPLKLPLWWCVVATGSPFCCTSSPQTIDKNFHNNLCHMSQTFATESHPENRRAGTSNHISLLFHTNIPPSVVNSRKEYHLKMCRPSQSWWRTYQTLR